jgi:hypothetical protein
VEPVGLDLVADGGIVAKAKAAARAARKQDAGQEQRGRRDPPRSRRQAVAVLEVLHRSSVAWFAAPGTPATSVEPRLAGEIRRVPYGQPP